MLLWLCVLPAFLAAADEAAAPDTFLGFLFVPLFFACNRNNHMMLS